MMNTEPSVKPIKLILQYDSACSNNVTQLWRQKEQIQVEQSFHGAYWHQSGQGQVVDHYGFLMGDADANL